MTELSFLIDLLMNHKLPRVTKELIATRIKEVETMMVSKPTYTVAPGNPLRLNTAPMEQAVGQIAQTPATQAALAARQKIMEGKVPDAITTGKDIVGPRKW